MKELKELKDQIAAQPFKVAFWAYMGVFAAQVTATILFFGGLFLLFVVGKFLFF